MYYLVKIEFPEINFICLVSKDYVVFHVEPYDKDIIMKDIRNIYRMYKDDAIFTKKTITKKHTEEETLKKMSDKNPHINKLIEQFELETI